MINIPPKDLEIINIVIDFINNDNDKIVKELIQKLISKNFFNTDGMSLTPKGEALLNKYNNYIITKIEKI